MERHPPCVICLQPITDTGLHAVQLGRAAAVDSRRRTRRCFVRSWVWRTSPHIIHHHGGAPKWRRLVRPWSEHFCVRRVLVRVRARVCARVRVRARVRVHVRVRVRIMFSCCTQTCPRSISTMFFFYLAYPALLPRLQRLKLSSLRSFAVVMYFVQIGMF